jgi:hypothetical protein
LNLLDPMIELDGVVVLFNDSHPEVPENFWHSAYKKVIEHYTEGDFERQKRRSPEWPKHEAVLRFAFPSIDNQSSSMYHLSSTCSSGKNVAQPSILTHLSLLAGSATRESAPELNRGQKVCTTAGMF